MSVYTIKLISGEELIAKVTHFDADYIKVDRPRVFQVGQNAQGNMTAGLIPYFISAPDQKDIKLSQSAIAASFEASKEVSDSYLQHTTSLILG